MGRLGSLVEGMKRGIETLQEGATLRWHRQRLEAALPPSPGMVLPRIEGTPAGIGGFMQRAGGNLDIALSVLAGVLALVILYLFGAAFARGGVVDIFGALVFNGFCGLILYVLVQRIRSNWMHAVELTVARWPLRLGEETTIRYRDSMRGNTKIVRATATLLFVEIASYRNDDNESRTARNKKGESLGEAAPSQQADGSILFAWKLRIPADGTPSLRGVQSAIAWQVLVEIKVERGPDSAREFDLLVVPEILS